MAATATHAATPAAACPRIASSATGLPEGRGSAWLCLPFLEAAPGETDAWRVARHWWGDRQATRRYCLEAVRGVIREFGLDGQKVTLAGFSRGAIGVHHVGLQDDEIASLWAAFLCHSHYDGVRRWGQPEDDAASARARLARRGSRPEWISHEGSVAEIEAYLKGAGLPRESQTLVPLPFRNHSAAWVLRDLPERRQLREWYAGVIGP